MNCEKRNMYHIFIVISRTHTKFGKIVRLFSGSRFNHASIAFDESLTEWFAFARSKKKNMLSARLVKENHSRYVDYQGPVNCRIYKIPVSQRQYEAIRRKVGCVYQDKDFIYNYASILTYPVLKGISCYKAFTCVEFIAYLLQKLGMSLSKEPSQISPDELAADLAPYLYYQGDLTGYIKKRRHIYKDNGEYFKRLTLLDVMKGIKTIQMTKNRLI